MASRLTRYRPRRRYPHRHRACCVVLYNLRAALTMSRSSPIYSPRLTRHQTRQVLLATTLVTFTRHHTRRVASYSLSSSPPVSSSTSYLSRRIAQLPAVCPSASSANNVTKLADLFATSYSPLNSSSLARHHTRHVYSPLHSWRHVFLAIVLAAGIFIDIVLVASYCTTLPSTPNPRHQGLDGKAEYVGPRTQKIQPQNPNY